eukprot:TRINITY_DN15081_c0_g1_i1.p1 TRINITY_DN15081_c0_g1~~TRINITY_DN15081_c0_g1_i1.p1  ORF type:complete len:285 (+),score=55.40 TRINITY_DN15081_c0_g1_i1:88-855(+)
MPFPVRSKFLDIPQPPKDSIRSSFFTIQTFRDFSQTYHRNQKFLSCVPETHGFSESLFGGELTEVEKDSDDASGEFSDPGLPFSEQNELPLPNECTVTKGGGQDKPPLTGPTTVSKVNPVASKLEQNLQKQLLAKRISSLSIKPLHKVTPHSKSVSSTGGPNQNTVTNNHHPTPTTLTRTQDLVQNRIPNQNKNQNQNQTLTHTHSQNQAQTQNQTQPQTQTHSQNCPPTQTQNQNQTQTQTLTQAQTQTQTHTQ